MKQVQKIALLLAGFSSLALAGAVAAPAPEVDGGVAAGAFALLSGVVLVWRSRR